MHRLIDMNNLAAAGRILWGAAFSLAILKTIKVNLINILGTRTMNKSFI